MNQWSIKLPNTAEFCTKWWVAVLAKKKTENANKLVKVADQNSVAFLVLFRFSSFPLVPWASTSH